MSTRETRRRGFRSSRQGGRQHEQEESAAILQRCHHHQATKDGPGREPSFQRTRSQGNAVGASQDRPGAIPGTFWLKPRKPGKPGVAAGCWLGPLPNARLSRWLRRPLPLGGQASSLRVVPEAASGGWHPGLSAWRARLEAIYDREHRPEELVCRTKCVGWVWFRWV